MKETEKNIERDGDLLKRKYTGANYPIDENTEYPFNGKVLIEGLLADIRGLKEEVEKILPSLRKRKNIMRKKLIGMN